MKNRGIVLITTMLLLMFIVMISTLLVVSGRNSMKLGASYAERERAFYAAESGMAYAQRCILTNSTWTSQDGYRPGDLGSYSYMDGDGTSLVVTSITGSGGYNAIKGVIDGDSQFFIAFCDGKTSGVTPSSGIDYNSNKIKYYSVNNFKGSQNKWSYQYTSSMQHFREVPKGRAHMIVEGRAGQVVRYIEAFLDVGQGDYLDSSMMAGGKVDVNLNTSQYQFKLTDKYSQGVNLRSIGKVNVTTSDPLNLYGNVLSIFSVSGSSITSSGNNTYVNNQVIDALNSVVYNVTANTSATQQAKITEINQYVDWNKMTNSYLQSNGAYNTGVIGDTLRAGTYVYLQKPGTNAYNLAYVPYLPEKDASNEYNYSQLMQRIGDGTTGYYNNSAGGNLIYLNDDFNNWKVGTEPVFNGSTNNVQFRSNGLNINLSNLNNAYLITANDVPVGVYGASVDIYGDTGWSTGTGYGFFTLVADYSGSSYVVSSDRRSSFGLKSNNDDNSENAATRPGIVTTVNGDIIIEGELSGQGSVISPGDIVFQGKSQLEPAKDSSLSIYSKEDIIIKEIAGGGTSATINNLLMQAIENLNTNTPGSNGYHGSGGGSEDDKFNNMLNDYMNQNVTYLLTTDTLKNMLNNTVTGLSYDSSAARDLGELFLEENTNYVKSGINKWEVDYHLPATNLVYPDFGDAVIKGLVFSEKNINVDIGNASLTIQGCIVSYGGNPCTQSAGSVSGTGNIKMEGNNILATYDPDYLQAIFTNVNGINTIRIFWNSWTPGRILNLNEL